VPNETRKGLPNGTTIFERVLPGPDRMYPDTDSAPIPIEEEAIERTRARLPESIDRRMAALRAWGAPDDVHAYILRRDLSPILAWLVERRVDSAFAATLLGHNVRHAMGAREIDVERVRWAVVEAEARGLTREILRLLVPLALVEPAATFDDLLGRVGYRKATPEEIHAQIARCAKAFVARHPEPEARVRALMGCIRPLAMGNVPLRDAAAWVEEATR
jgi:glutamyl-tRNA(Gln) amidotransferase subunit E